MEEQLLKSERRFKGNILELNVDTVRLPNGKEATREVVLHPGAVSVIAVEQDNVLMVRQYRHPVGEILWEVPAGKLDAGEAPIVCAKRELYEETGYKAKEWKLLSSFYTTPGFSNEKMYLYYATGLEEGEQSLDEDEFLTFEKVPLQEAFTMTLEGKIKDAKTIAGITLALLSQQTK